MGKFLLILTGFILAIGWATTDTIDFNKWVVKLQNVEQSNSEVGNVDISQRVRNLILKVNFDGDYTVHEYIAMNPRIARRFERNPISSRPVDTKFLSDGSVLAEYDVNLTGTLLKTLMPMTGGGMPLAPLCCPTCKRPWPETLAVPEGVTLIPKETGLTTNYTGIVIDASGLKLSPALFPKILNEDDKEVYGLSFVAGNSAQDLGLISYVHSLSDAYRNDRAGLNPLRIDALRVSGRLNCDIVIANSDAVRMHQSQSNLKLLEHCQVIVITSE